MIAEARVVQATSEFLPRAIDAAIEAIANNADLLGDLDRAIGDGDHGVNMLRGFSAIAAQRDELVALPLAAALEATRPLMATKGRASFLRERSVGHLDPGAYSSFLLVDAICGAYSKDEP